jgi:hypothetical protein
MGLAWVVTAALGVVALGAVFTTTVGWYTWTPPVARQLTHDAVVEFGVSE